MTNTNYPSATPPGQSQPPKSNSTGKNIAIGILAAGLLGTGAIFCTTKTRLQKRFRHSRLKALRI